MSDGGLTQWTPMYWGDYLRDTQDLDLPRHGAYLRLLAHYYTVGPPIPNESAKLYRICGAMDKSEKEAVDDVARRFFRTDGNGGLRHKRADLEIARRKDKSEKGRRGAKARWDKNKEDADA